MHQKMHPYRAMNINSVKIQTSLLMRRECIRRSISNRSFNNIKIDGFVWTLSLNWLRYLLPPARLLCHWRQPIMKRWSPSLQRKLSRFHRWIYFCIKHLNLSDENAGLEQDSRSDRQTCSPCRCMAWGILSLGRCLQPQGCSTSGTDPHTSWNPKWKHIDWVEKPMEWRTSHELWVQCRDQTGR